jgi:predicted short-subunit dehydrogenase-like oxidoreductase (DUF2520 family)
MRISLIGAGNLATRLGIALQAAGHELVQVYSRTETSAKTLADLLQASPVVRPESLTPVDLLVCALKDDALAEILPRVPVGNAILVHTAGSLPMDVLCPFARRVGVIYPLQTFNKQRAVDFSTIPVFLEASDEQTRLMLHELASGLGSAVEDLDSEGRLKLHLSAVFACNFVNYLYSISYDLLEEANLSFDALRPLIRETARRIEDNDPAVVQTGPAVRYDRTVMDKHLARLGAHPAWKELYEQLSLGIHLRSKQH